MDAHLGYNQMPMPKEEEEKTAFITEQGMFYFKVVPFDLWNTEATFPRLMDRSFQSHIDRYTEVFGYDILVQSRMEEDHLNNLEETFNNI